LNTYKKGLLDGIPICLGYISVSFAFGLMATKSGLQILSSVIISMTNLTSAGQFAGLEIIKSNGSLIELTIAIFFINIRYMLMSLSLSQKIDSKTGTLKRLLMSFGITDEIFAVSMQQPKNISFRYFLGLMTLPYLGWSSGTFLGAFASSVLPELIRQSLGLAIYGMFIAIIVPPARKSKPVLNVIIVAALTSIVLHITPVLKELSGGWQIIISTVIAAGVGAFLYPKEDENE